MFLFIRVAAVIVSLNSNRTLTKTVSKQKFLLCSRSSHSLLQILLSNVYSLNCYSPRRDFPIWLLILITSIRELLQIRIQWTLLESIVETFSYPCCVIEESRQSFSWCTLQLKIWHNGFQGKAEDNLYPPGMLDKVLRQVRVS